MNIDDDDFFPLRLQPPFEPSPPPPPLPTPIPQFPLYSQLMVQFQPFYYYAQEVAVPPTPTTMPPRTSPPRGGRPRRNPPRNKGNDNNNMIRIEPPYPWATDRPCYVHNCKEIEGKGIHTITGMVKCNKCEKEYEVGFNIKEKMDEILSFIMNEDEMHHRAVDKWQSPVSLKCKHCPSDCVKPIIDEDKDTINWLFLFLGQMLGVCTLEQLKYFCASTRIHRTGAKDRVLYYTYREILKQLVPDLPEDLLY